VRIDLDLGADQRGSVHGHSAQRFDRGFRIADLLHYVAISDMSGKVKENVSEGYMCVGFKAHARARAT
jgi:hypothetical protein